MSQYKEEYPEKKTFLEGKKNYLNNALRLELRLAELTSRQETENIFRQAIYSVGIEVARQPKLIELVANFFSKELDKSALSDLEIFFDKTPVARFIKSQIQHNEHYQEMRLMIMEKIFRYAQAVHRADQINQDKGYLFNGGKLERNTQTGKYQPAPFNKRLGQAGTTDYNFDRFLNLAATKLANLFIQHSIGNKTQSSEDTTGAQSETNLAQEAVPLANDVAQTRIELAANLGQETVPFSLLNWVVNTARKVRTEGLKIFDTPDTQQILKRLEAAGNLKNGLGGVILFGPPGTGKTELLIERHRRMGFKSRVISIHHYSDYVQLLGEKPLPMESDKATSRVQRLTLVRNALNEMTDGQRISFVRSKLKEGSEAWKLFLTLAEQTDDGKQDVTDEEAILIIKSLVAKLNYDLIQIGLGIQDGLDEESAWVRGEIIQAFDQGELPILDEMDKGSEHSFEGISRLLNLSPGSTISLGNQTYQIPSWAFIDGTANAMNLQPFLHDRFAPNIIYVDYPSSLDTLLKSLVWLADEQGQLHLSPDVQQKYLGLVLYVFPEIQKLYPEVLEHPLSNRGIRKFCQMLAHGRSVTEAVEDLLLKKGALTNSETGQRAINEILNRFGALISGEVSFDKPEIDASKKGMVNSPLFEAAKDFYQHRFFNEGKPQAVKVSDEVKAMLLNESEGDTFRQDDLFLAKTGAMIQIARSGKTNFLSVRVGDGEQIAGVMEDNLNRFLVKENSARIVAADSRGQFVLLRSNDQWALVNIASGKVKIFDGGEKQYNLTNNGDYLIGTTANQEIQLVPIVEAFVNQERPAGIKVIDENRQPIVCERYDLSTDGFFLLIENLIGKSFVIDLRSIRAGQSEIVLVKPISEKSGWIMGAGNTLFNPDVSEVFLL